MTTRHTPGPWQAGTHTTAKGERIVMAEGLNPVAIVHNGDIRAAYDAALIAAAPELLAALKAHQALFEDMARFVKVMALQDYALFNEAPALARAAIAKAEGRAEK